METKFFKKCDYHFKARNISSTDVKCAFMYLNTLDVSFS